MAESERFSFSSVLVYYLATISYTSRNNKYIHKISRGGKEGHKKPQGLYEMDLLTGGPSRTGPLKISRQTDLICWKENRLPSQTLTEFHGNAKMRHHAYGM